MMIWGMNILNSQLFWWEQEGFDGFWPITGGFASI